MQTIFILENLQFSREKERRLLENSEYTIDFYLLHDAPTLCVFLTEPSPYLTDSIVKIVSLKRKLQLILS